MLLTVSSFCICIFNFCSSGSGWKKNMGKTLLRICKKPKIFWANTKSRQSCIRLLEEGSGITTSHLCHHSHTATTQQRPNCKRSNFFFLSTFEKHLAMFSIPSSRLSAVSHANCWFIESFLMTLCMCVYECVSHSFVIWAGLSSVCAQRQDPVTVAEAVCLPATAISPSAHIAWHLLWG